MLTDLSKLPFFSFIILFSGGAACTSSQGRLQNLLKTEDFAAAASFAAKDPDTATDMAVLILERTARVPAHRYFALERLSAAGKRGRSALKRLSSSPGELGHAARIARNRFDKPDAKTAKQCAMAPNANIRKLCARAWHRFLPEEILKTLLLDTDPEVRLFALKGLASLPASSTRAALFSDALLRDPSLKVRLEAARQGALLGEDALLLLKDRLADETPGMRAAAVSGIARIESAAAMDLLLSTARAPLDSVCLTAAAELARRGDAFGKERLLEAARDPRPSIRSTSLYLLSYSKVENLNEILLRALDDEAPAVVIAAANLLRNDEEVRNRVVAALRKIASLETAKKNEARTLLAFLGDAEALRDIAAILQDAEAVSTAELTSLLRRMGGAIELFDAAAQLMGDSREEVRIQAAVYVIFSQSKI